MSSDLATRVIERQEQQEKLSLSQWFDKKAIQNRNTAELKPLILGYMELFGKEWDGKGKLQFANYCIALNLNPFNNDIYMVKYGSTFSPLINFKKFIEIAQSDPNYGGVEYERHFRDKDGRMLPLEDRYIIVRALYKNGAKPYEKEFSMNEFYSNTGQWKVRPNYMLEKVATKLTLEQAFRSQQSLNLYTPEEMVGNTSESYDKNFEDDIKKIETMVEEEPEEKKVTIDVGELLNA